MATTLFKDTTYSVHGLVEDIQSGEVALPDIQRPFVWGASKVRDLLDSMYKGFPVGYLLFWETGAEGGARQIGTGGKQKAARLLIVDGQQRLTSLYAVMTGSEIIKADYSTGRIRIAFRPADATFAVTDAAIEKDPEFIADVSAVWAPGGYRRVVKAFISRLEAKRELSEEEEDHLDDSIDRLRDLQDYPFKAVELAASVDEERVAEVFVRINSEGVTLNQADFILTLMSVFWEKGRLELEAFSRACKQPTQSTASPFNWHIQPSPSQMLRVTVALAFRRAVLKHVYTLLRGRDVETGRTDPGRRDKQFASLQAALDESLDLTNWHEFLRCLDRAGFRGSKMISSDNALLLCYALWLIGRVDYGVPLDQLREVIARWFFMAQTTGRYTGSFESRFEQDLARFDDLDRKDAAGYVRVLQDVMDETLTSDYWSITLPNELGTSASKSPSLLAYIASLNILDADALLSTGKVRGLLDPVVTAKKGIERHHIFPRAYLRSKLGVSDNKDINQIANMALVEWADNIAISDSAPSEYWPEQLGKKQLADERLAQQMRWHALPEGWQDLDYPDFLTQRRRLMGAVVREAFEHLKDQAYSPSYPSAAGPAGDGGGQNEMTEAEVSVMDLLEGELLVPGNQLMPADGTTAVVATVLPDGKIAFDGEIHSDPHAAAAAATDGNPNGWAYWAADTADGRFTLAALREVVQERRV